MRRAKIRPSINLSASRRSVATPAAKSKDSVAPKPDAATPKSGSSSTSKSPTPQPKEEKSLGQEDHLEVEVPPKSRELQEQNQHQEKQQPQDDTKQSPSQQLEPAQPHPAAPKTTQTTTPMAAPMTTPTPRTAPRARLRAIPNLPPRAKPRATPSATPNATPRTTPRTTPSSMPSATPSATLKTTPSDTPSATPNATPSATPNATPTSRTAPKTSPVTTPNATPSAPPTTDHQSTLLTIDKHSPNSGPNLPPESPTKASNVRRKRITAVPNLGQPRLRSNSASAVKVAARPKVNSAPEKEHGKGMPSLGAGSVGAGPETVAKSESKNESMGPPVQPPPIQRVVSAKAPTTPTPSKEPSTASSVSPDVPSSHTEAVTTSQASHTLAVTTPQKPLISRSESVTENIYQKKLQELQDRMEAETPSRRRRHYVNRKAPPPERSKMTMSDLIYFNPKTSPMKWVHNQKNTSPNKKKFPQTSLKKQDVDENDSINNSTHNSENEDEEKDEEDVDPFAPRVKIGPDGSLILDSSSLVKDASPAKTLHMDSDVIQEEESNTTYSSFRKRTHTTAWNERETDKFFRALSAVGTDFSMINAMFPKRTRQQIKNKFKREERHNRQRIDKAITNKTHFDMALFYKESTSESEGTKNRKKEEKKKKAKEKRKAAAKERTKRQKKGTAKGKGKRRNAGKDKESDNDSDLELSDLEVNSKGDGDEIFKADDDQICKADADEISKDEIAVVNSAGEEETRVDENARESDGSEDEVNIKAILGQPTRSGRQPKFRTSFTVEEPKRKPRGPYQPKLNADEDYAIKRLERLEKERNIVLAKKRADRDQFPPYTPGEFVRTPTSSGEVAGVGEEVEGAQVAGEGQGQAPVVIQNGTVTNQDLTLPERRGVSTITTPMGRFIVSVPQTSRDREGTSSGPHRQNLTTAASQNRVPRKPIRSHIFVISSPDGKQNIIHVPVQPDNSLPEDNRVPSSAPSASAPRFHNPMTTPRIMLKTTVRNPQQTPTIRVRQMNMTPSQHPAMSPTNNRSPSNSPLILMNSQARRAAQASPSPQQSPNSLKRKQSPLEPFALQPVSGSNKIIIMSPQAQIMSSNSRTSNSGVPTRVAYVPVGKQGTETSHHHEQVVSFQNQGGDNPESHLTFEVNRTNPPTPEPAQKVSHMTSDMSTDWLLRDETVGHEVDIPSSELEEEEVAETEEAFVPPSSNVRQSPPADNGRDQVMEGHVSEEQLTAQQILEQLTYKEGVEDDVGANMEVNNEEIITQIATEMTVE